MEDAQTPNQTLYVHNLNEKIKKLPLKQQLYALFSQFGKVVDIVACRGIRLRGQAWVVFEDVGAASNAMRRLEGFNFFDKPLRIQFAKEKSDVIAKKDGTFSAAVKRKRLERKEEEEEKMRRITEERAARTGAAEGRGAAGLIVNEEPNKTLLAQALPAQADQSYLDGLFRGFPGFVGVRMVPAKQLAFVDFENATQAGAARGLKHEFADGEMLHLTYAK